MISPNDWAKQLSQDGTVSRHLERFMRVLLDCCAIQRLRHLRQQYRASHQRLLWLQTWPLLVPRGGRCLIPSLHSAIFFPVISRRKLV